MFLKISTALDNSQYYEHCETTLLISLLDPGFFQDIRSIFNLLLL